MVSCPFCLKKSDFARNFALLEFLEMIQDLDFGEKNQQIGGSTEKQFDLRLDQKKIEEDEKRRQKASQNNAAKRAIQGGICELCFEKEALHYCVECPINERYLCEDCSNLIHSFAKFRRHQVMSVLQFRLPLPPPYPPPSPSSSSAPSPSPSPSFKTRYSPRSFTSSSSSTSGSSSSSSSFPIEIKQHLPEHNFSSSNEEQEQSCLKDRSSMTKKAKHVTHLFNTANLTKAFRYAYKHSQTDPDCAALLGLCFFDGYGTPIINSEAKVWAGFGAESGSNLAKGILYYTKQYYAKAFKYLLPFAKEGNSVCQRCVGRFFDWREDYSVAFQYYWKSSQQVLFLISYYLFVSFSYFLFLFLTPSCSLFSFLLFSPLFFLSLLQGIFAGIKQSSKLL